MKAIVLAGLTLMAVPAVSLAQSPADTVGTYRGKMNLTLFNYETGKIQKGKADVYLYISNFDSQTWYTDVDVDVSGMDTMLGWGISGVKDGYFGVQSLDSNDNVITTSQGTMHFKKGKIVGNINLSDYEYAGEGKLNLKKISNSTGTRTPTEEKKLGIKRAEKPNNLRTQKPTGLGKIDLSKN